jgi:hypothetical protein
LPFAHRTKEVRRIISPDELNSSFSPKSIEIHFICKVLFGGIRLKVNGYIVVVYRFDFVPTLLCMIFGDLTDKTTSFIRIMDINYTTDNFFSKE